MGHGNELNFFPSIVVRIVGRKITLIYVVKNYSDCCVRNRLRTANAKSTVPERETAVEVWAREDGGLGRCGCTGEKETRTVRNGYKGK